MARRPAPNFTSVKPTPAEADSLRVARVGFMDACFFLSYLYISQVQEVFTYEVDTAATDGRRCFINPAYFAKMRPGNRVFILAHEEDHRFNRHPQRFNHYAETKGPDGKPFNWELGNIAADYVINARLVENKIGDIHPSWLLHPDVTGDMLWEDVYCRLHKACQNPPPKGPGGQPGHMPLPPPGTPAKAPGGHLPGVTPGGIPVSTAGKNGTGPAKDPGGDVSGPMRDVFSPAVDPVSGREDVPSEMDHKEGVARAAAAAKGQGKLPATYQKMVEEMLEPQISWAEHIRLEFAGRIGNDSSTWTKLNRRRICLNPMVGLPGRRGFGCDTIVVGFDTSGSIWADKQALAVMFAELGGIITDCRPRELIVVQCDAKVQQVDYAACLDEVEQVRTSGVKGGGGTSFVPVFDWCAENNVKPDMLVYLTDMYGTMPGEAPGYPVLWCSSSEVDTAPFGTVIQVSVDNLLASA